MTEREYEFALELLDEFVESAEAEQSEVSGEWSLTVHWLAGGDKLFCTWDEVTAWWKERYPNAPF